MLEASVPNITAAQNKIAAQNSKYFFFPLFLRVRTLPVAKLLQFLHFCSQDAVGMAVSGEGEAGEFAGTLT